MSCWDFHKSADKFRNFISPLLKIFYLTFTLPHYFSPSSCMDKTVLKISQKGVTNKVHVCPFQTKYNQSFLTSFCIQECLGSKEEKAALPRPRCQPDLQHILPPTTFEGSSTLRPSPSFFLLRILWFSIGVSSWSDRRASGQATAKFLASSLHLDLRHTEM